MDEKIIVALITLSGVIISVILSFVISRRENKMTLKKIDSEFSGKLYSKRLEVYLEIFEIVSGLCKMIDGKVSYEDLNDFSEKYLYKDSKYGLLFSSYVVKASYNLRKEMRKILASQKKESILDKGLMHNFRRQFLTKVELALKFELGIFGYENPSTMENYNLTKTYLEIWTENE